MKFGDMPYGRITYETIERDYQALFQELKAVSSEEDCFSVLKKRDRLLADMTPIDLCYVRHSMNVNDPFYRAEQEYYDEIEPKITALSNRFDRLLIESPFASCFEKLMGSFAFSVIRTNLTGNDSRLIGLQQEENALCSQYNQLVSNGKVRYNGKTVSRSSLTPEKQSPDRETRRRISGAIAVSWEEQREQLEDIYDRQVKNRDRQAKILGYPHYAALSHLRMNRIGYTPEDVASFRERVKMYIVPIGAMLFERRRERLGLSHLYLYDDPMYFPNGNPVPLGGDAFCLEMTRRMYSRLSPETEEFIRFLLDNDLCDVALRDGKSTGGYCTQFEAYRAPFIFANFDGTCENAYVMSHEGGHAFACYLKRHEEIQARCCCTPDLSETHAMSMEFFVSPYMDLFFGGRAADYRRMHLESAVRLILYECQQDEFQQIIYEQPQLNRQQRNRVWERLERVYFPYREYTEAERQRIGFQWQRIPHLYFWPFYAIDYALAQICALEYFQWMNEDFDGAWNSYLAFCRSSGTMNFPETIRAAGLKGPFDAENLKNLADWLLKETASSRPPNVPAAHSGQGKER